MTDTLEAVGQKFGRIALSSMWAQRFPDSDLAPFFDAGRAMGFERFELSHNLTGAAVSLVVPGSEDIVSVHHPCPRDVASGASYLSASASTRREAAAALEKTVHLAHRLSARAVVFHLGVATDAAPEIARRAFELVSRFRAGQSSTDWFRAARDDVAEQILAVESRTYDAVAEALVQPLETASSLGVVIAFETGHDPVELPTPSGAAWLLKSLGSLGLQAWLDTGHVAAQAALQLATAESWFAAAAGRWAGAHIHDAVGLRDHLPPGAGVLDLAASVAALPADACITLEVDWYLEPSEVVAGAAVLARLIETP